MWLSKCTVRLALVRYSLFVLQLHSEVFASGNVTKYGGTGLNILRNDFGVLGPYRTPGIRIATQTKFVQQHDMFWLLARNNVPG